MGIEIKIEAANAEDAQKQMAKLLAGAAISFGQQTQPVVETTAEPIEPDKLANHRAPRKKADKPQPEPAEGNAATSTTDDAAPSSGTASKQTEAGQPTQDSDEPTVEYAQVRTAVNQLAAAKGRQAVIDILDEFGVDNATKLKEEQWADALARLQEAKEAA